MCRNLGRGIVLRALTLCAVLFIVSGAVQSAPVGVVSSSATGMKVSGKVTNSSGTPLAAYIRVFNSQRTKYSIDLVAQAYADINGEFSITMPDHKVAGDYQVVVYRGPEYEYLSTTVALKPGSDAVLDVRLERIVDMAAQGWYAGDVHQHSRAVADGQGSDGNNTPSEMAHADVAMGLHFGVLTDHNQTVGTAANEFRAEGARYITDSVAGYFLPIGGNEVTTYAGGAALAAAGHYNVWEPSQDCRFYAVDYMVDTNAKAQSVARIAADASANALLSVINHPNADYALAPFGVPGSMSFIETGFDWVANKDLVAQFDAVEIWNGGNGFFTTAVGDYGHLFYFGKEHDPAYMDVPEGKHLSFARWYELLNSGMQFPSVGASDSHERLNIVEGGLYDQMIGGVRAMAGGQLPPLPASMLVGALGVEGAIMYQVKESAELGIENLARLPGSPRTYVHVDEGQLSPQTIADAVRLGKSFVTNGPLVIATLNGAGYGNTVDIGSKQELSIDIVSARPFDKIQIISDGQMVKEIALPGVTRFRDTIEVPELTGKRWMIVYVEGGPDYQFAYTNPIYLAGGK